MQRARSALFQEALRSNPDFAEALLELANLRIADKKFAEAADLLRRYVKVSREPGIRILQARHGGAQSASDRGGAARLERISDAFERCVQRVRTLTSIFSITWTTAAKLAPRERTQLDLTELTEQIQKHPDQPEDLYLLAEAYLKLGQTRRSPASTIAQLDQLSSGDYRTQTGVGVLLARYRLYDDAIQHFQTALRANPDSDDSEIRPGGRLFPQRRMYAQALEAAQQVSATGQQDDAFLALLGDIHAHLGETARAAEIFRDAIARNPDNDQYYLSLTLVQLRDE